MPTLIKPRDLPRSSRIEPAVFDNDSTTTESVQPPIVWHGSEDSSSSTFFHPAVEYVESSSVFQCPAEPVVQHIPCRRKDVPLVRHHHLVDLQRCYPTLASAISRHAVALRSRQRTAGFHSRLQERFFCSHFFPRSVGLGPTASIARGALTMPPSMLCHAQAIPSISSYSASPLRHSRTKTPRFFHSKKYLCTELALPNRSLGNAFHWHPVRNTYTIPANIFRESSGLRPPPGRRLYFRPFARFRCGINGATFSHSVSATSHEYVLFMPEGYHYAPISATIYLRISSWETTRFSRDFHEI